MWVREEVAKRPIETRARHAFISTEKEGHQKSISLLDVEHLALYALEPLTGTKYRDQCDTKSLQAPHSPFALAVKMTSAAAWATPPTRTELIESLVSGVGA